MFDELRRNTKTILWITILAFVGGFVFLELGTSGSLFQRQVAPNEIGSVNGSPISTYNYNQIVSATFQNIQAQTGQPVDDQTAVLIRKQAWDNLVQQTLLQQEVDRLGIGVTDEEIRQAVLTQPLPELQQYPQFQTDGRFDLAKYQAMLRNPQFDTRPIEAQFRANLPLQKLEQMMMATVVVPEQELWESFRVQNEKRQVEYLMVSARTPQFQVDDTSIKKEEIEQYYQAHRNTYRKPPEASIEYVSFPKVYSYDDSMNTLDLIRSLHSDVKEGDDLLEMIADFSEAPSNQRGGEEATWVTPAVLPPLLRDAVEALPPDQVSDVIIEPSGFHVVRVEGKQDDETAGTQYKIADLFLPLEPSPVTAGDILERAVTFRQQVTEGGFKAVAEDTGLEISITKPFTEQGFIQPLGVAPQVQQFAFSAEVGTVSGPIERAEGWIVARLESRRDASIPELPEVETRVRREVADSIAVARAKEVAQRHLVLAQGGTALETLAEDDTLAVFDRPDPFARLGFARGIGNDPKVIGKLFGAEGPGLIPEVLTGRNGAFVVKVTDVTPADRDLFAEQKSQLLESARQAKQSQFLSAWISDLQKRADIKDYRSGVFF